MTLQPWHRRCYCLISFYWPLIYSCWSNAVVGENGCRKLFDFSDEDLKLLAQVKALQGLLPSGKTGIDFYACSVEQSQSSATDSSTVEAITQSSPRKLDSLRTAAEEAFREAGVSVPIAAEDPSSFSRPSIAMYPYSDPAQTTPLVPAFPDVSSNAEPNAFVESTIPTAFSAEPVGNEWKRVEPKAFEVDEPKKPLAAPETSASAEPVYSPPKETDEASEGGEEKENEEKTEGEEEGKEEEGAEEEEEGEEEEEFSSMDVGIGGMLLGSVGFVMIIFYFVNWQDDDIRRYSWSIISTTVSIFTAVLCFSGVNELLMLLFEEALHFERGGFTLVIISYVFFLLWLIATEVLIGNETGSCTSYIHANLFEEVWVIANAMRYDYGSKMDTKFVRNPDAMKSIADFNGCELFVHKRPIHKEQTERRTVALRTLFSHMTGFAAIHAGGQLQHTKLFKQNAYMSLAAVLINRAFLILLFKISERLHAPHPNEAGKEEDSESDHEDPKAYCVELCREEVKEAENDIASLATSFLLVQAVRFGLTGVLPNNEGIQECGPPPMNKILCLVGFGMLCMMVVVVILHTGLALKYRQLFILQNTMGMSLSWCLFWASRWTAEGSSYLQTLTVTPQTMAGRVFLALTLSGIALLVILSLDTVEDKLGEAVGGDGVHGLIQNIINALSLLVGFAWEHCFEYAFEAIASITINPLVTKVVFTVLVGTLVTPAWRRYILVKVIQLKQLQDEEAKASQKRAAELFKHGSK
mmetsp:Transcript_49930/g.79326  ORF Transcript_49930/g.79326 Transcript_49930/m.79326 type:complete len:753 (+) Transcript_49930:120-2378(+)